jgi:outer membrane protein insertion porin family
MIRALLSLLLLVRLGVSFAQTTPAMDYGFPEEYEIGGITVSGTLSTDPNAVKLFTGLQVGDKITIPGDRISRAIRNLWEQRLFSDVRIEAAEVRGRTMFLNIIVEEKPRLSRFKFEGATRSESDKLREEIDLVVGQQVNEALLANTRYQVQRYYSEKGYLKAKAVIVERPDTLRGNSVLLIIEVDKGRKVKIKDVTFEGNEALKDKRLRRALKKTKRKRWWNFFGTSKFDSQEFKNDKNRLLDVYNNEGYRNASIVRDTTYFVSDDRMNVDLVIEEGPLFHFRNVNFTGNTKYTSETVAAASWASARRPVQQEGAG